MKKSILCHSIFLLFMMMIGHAALAQKPLASPRDSVKGKIGSATVAVNYGSPSVKGRTIWGKLVPYNKVWRAGANEATTFTTDKPLKIEGKELPAGQYGFFTIPGEKEWTIIFNKTAKQWGAFEYRDKDDALRVNVTPAKSQAMNERLVYKITNKGLVLLWENLEVPLRITE